MDTMLTVDTGSDRAVGAGYAEAVNGTGTPPRRQYPLELKRRVVEETFAPGASVSIVARRHDLNANLVFEWRKQYRYGRLWNGTPPPPAKRVTTSAGSTGQVMSGPAPATSSAGQSLIRIGVIDHEGEVRLRPIPVEPSAPPPPPPSPREAVAPPTNSTAIAGRIEIELPNGFKVRVEGEVDERALTRVLATIKELA
jgi:transposase-like protein